MKVDNEKGPKGEGLGFQRFSNTSKYRYFEFDLISSNFGLSTLSPHTSNQGFPDGFHSYQLNTIVVFRKIGIATIEKID